MSQSPQPTDTQALLQSMLEKLKLQSARENQAYLQTPASITNTSTQEQNVGIIAPSYQQPNTFVNMFSGNGDVGKSHTSFTSLNANIDHDTGESKVLEQAAWRGFTPPTSGQLFPVSQKDTGLMPTERTKKERLSFGSFSFKRDKLPESHFMGSTSKIHLWSMKNRDAGMANHGSENVQTGNGEVGSLDQSTDTQITINHTKTTLSRRKQRSSENKTRRWTLKIKERWKEKQGSLDGKGKEEGGMAEQMTGQETQSLMKTPDEGVLKTQGEDNFFDTSFRPTGDPEIGLGSFSLLEEIASGQEWAKFLNPNYSALSTNQTHLKEQMDVQKIQQNPINSNQMSRFTNPLQSEWNLWSFNSNESTPGTIYSMPKPSHQTFTTGSMDMSERKQQEDINRQSVHSEAMEDTQSAGTQPRLQLRPSSFPAQADISNSSAGKARVQSSRKRQHQSAGRGDERLQTETINQVKVTGCMSSTSPVSYDVMNESGETQQHNVIHLNSFNSHHSPLPISPTNAFPPALRSVLRHPMTRGAESSAEILTKRRRVEENRRVHFSENVVAISSPDLDLDITDSEADSVSEADVDSVADLEYEGEQTVAEEQAPSRRNTLPAWILALKRKNTGKKHR